MVKRRELVGAIGGAGVAFLAGCSNSSSEEPSKGANSSRDTPQLSELSYPPGFSSDGVASVDDAVASHKEQLLPLSNYTEDWVLETIESGGETSGDPTEMTLNADPTDRELYFHYKDHRWNVDVFYDGTFYEHDVKSDEVREGGSDSLFSDVSKKYRPLSFWATNILMSSLLNTMVIEASGGFERGERRGIEYTVTGVDEAQKRDRVTYNGANGQLLVTESGGIIDIEYTPLFESENTSLQSISYQISAIGETSVERPEWVS